MNLSTQTFSFNDDDDDEGNDQMSTPLGPRLRYELTLDVMKKKLPLTAPPLLRRVCICL